MKHFGIFNTSGELETAISQSAITEPYVVMVSGDVYYNTVGETGMTGCWIEDSQGNIYSGIPVDDAYSFEYDKPSGATWTLYENGHVVTVRTYYMELHEDCEGVSSVVEVVEEDDYTVEDITMGTGSITDEPYVHLEFLYKTPVPEVNGAITVFYCNPEPSEPCAGMDQDVEDCNDRGGVWDYVNCLCNEPPSESEPEPYPDPCAEYEEGTQEKCECEGKFWWGDECHDEPEPEPSESEPSE